MTHRWLDLFTGKTWGVHRRGRQCDCSADQVDHRPEDETGDYVPAILPGYRAG